jgi:hypothetical protein
MAIPEVKGPRIRFQIDGIIALCVHENRNRFDVGVVRTTKGNGDIPGHNFSMTIIKNGGEKSLVEYDSGNIPRELFLKVIDQSPSVGIELYTPGLFMRKIRNDNNHFKWALDIGNGELHSGPVDIHHRAIRSVLRVTGVESALFYTSILSSDQLEVKINHDKRKIGYIAGSIEALIPLPQGGAVFSAGHGGKTIHLDPKEDAAYDVIIRQVCSSDETCSKADVTEIFRDLFSIRNHGAKIEIIGLPHTHTQVSNDEGLQDTILHSLNPEVGCLGVNFSGNNDLP